MICRLQHLRDVFTLSATMTTECLVTDVVVPKLLAENIERPPFELLG